LDEALEMGKVIEDGPPMGFWTDFESGRVMEAEVAPGLKLDMCAATEDIVWELGTGDDVAFAALRDTDASREAANGSCVISFSKLTRLKAEESKSWALLDELPLLRSPIPFSPNALASCNCVRCLCARFAGEVKQAIVACDLDCCCFCCSCCCWS